MKYTKYIISLLLLLTIGYTQFYQRETKTRSLIPRLDSYYDVGREGREYDSLFVDNAVFIAITTDSVYTKFLEVDGTVIGIDFQGAYTNAALDFTDVTLNHGGSSGPVFIRAGTYASPVSSSDAGQSGMIRLYGLNTATTDDESSGYYDRAIFAYLRTDGSKGIFPIAGLAEVRTVSGAGPTAVMAGQFIAHLQTTGAKLATSSGSAVDGMFGSWFKVTAIDGATVASDSRIAPIWIDNQMYGANAISDEEYGIYATTGGSKPKAFIGFGTSSVGYDNLLYYDSDAYDQDPVYQSTSLKVLLNTTQHYILLSTTAPEYTFSSGLVLGTSYDDVQPIFSIVGDADSDAGGDTEEALSIVLDDQTNPTLSTWSFTSTQSSGYKFDKPLFLAETTTPTAIADYGAVYTKSDNLWYVQSGDGVEKVLSPSPAYSSLWYHGGESTTTIGTQNLFHQVTDFANVGEEDASSNIVGDATTDDDLVVGTNGAGVYELCAQSSFRNSGGGSTNMLIAAGITLATPIAIASSTDATPIVVTTSAAHGLKSGDMVRISGHATNVAANTDCIITVTDATHFELKDLSHANIAGSGSGAGSGGNVDVVFPGNVVVHRIVSQNDLGRGMAQGTYRLAASDIIEFYVADLDGTSNFISVNNVFCLTRIDI